MKKIYTLLLFGCLMPSFAWPMERKRKKLCIEVNTDFAKLSQEERDKLLLTAAQEGDLADLKALLQAGANPNFEDKDPGGRGNKPLHAAALNGHTTCLEELIKAGADIHAKDDTGINPLNYAAWQDHAECVKALLKAGAERDEHEAWHPYANTLEIAVHYKNIDCVKVLIEEKPYTSGYLEYGLRAAIEHNSSSCMKLIIEEGPNMESNCLQTGIGSSCLEVAIEHYSKKNQCAQFIVDIYKNLIDTSLVSSNNLIRVAIDADNTEAVELLTDKDVDINAQDEKGLTVLHYVFNSKYHRKPCKELKSCKDIAEILLKKGADSTIQDDEGNTPLHYAAQRGNNCTWALELLTKYKADPAIKNNLGLTHFEEALQFDQEKYVEEVGKKLIAENSQKTYTLEFSDGTVTIPEYSRFVCGTLKALSEDGIDLAKNSIPCKGITKKTWDLIAPHLEKLVYITKIKSAESVLKKQLKGKFLLAIFFSSDIEKWFQEKLANPLMDDLSKLAIETLEDIQNAANYLEMQALLILSSQIIAKKATEKVIKECTDKVPKDLKILTINATINQLLEIKESLTTKSDPN